jgi:hypothetical protein
VVLYSAELKLFTCFYSETNQLHNISHLFYFGTTLYLFRTVFPSIIRSLRLYIQHEVHAIQVLRLLLASSHRTEQKRTGQDRTGQDRTEQNRTGQDRTGQDGTGQNRTEQNRTEQNRTEQNRQS